MKSACNHVLICLALATSVLGVPSLARGQTDGVKLQWKFTAGEKLSVETGQDISTTSTVGGQTMETTNTSSTWMTWEVAEVNPEGVATVETVIKRLTMEIEAPMGSVSIDTQGNKAEGANAGMIASSVRPLIDQVISQQMTTRGTVSSVSIPQELTDALNAAGGAGSSELLKNVTRNATLEFPDEPLKVNDSWKSETETVSPAGNISVVNTYTYKGLATIDSREFHHFDVDIKMAFADAAVTIDSQETTGDLYFDAAAGRIDRSRVEQDIRMTISVNGQTINQDLKQIAILKFKPVR